MFGAEKRLPSFQIQVKYHGFDGTGTTWRTIHTGPWDNKAEYVWRMNSILPRRRVRNVTEAETQAVMYGHPDLVDLEKHVDRFYALPGEANEAPNRLADFDRLRDIQRRDAA